MPDPSDSFMPIKARPHEGIDRKCKSCEMKDEDEEENLEISRKSLNLSYLEASDEVLNEINCAHSSSSSTALDSSTREFMESRFARDFSNVRIFTDERAAKSAQSVNARAYTVGNDVVLGQGHYQPNTLANV